MRLFCNSGNPRHKTGEKMVTFTLPIEDKLEEMAQNPEGLCSDPSAHEQRSRGGRHRILASDKFSEFEVEFNSNAVTGDHELINWFFT